MAPRDLEVLTFDIPAMPPPHSLTQLTSCLLPRSSFASSPNFPGPATGRSPPFCAPAEKTPHRHLLLSVLTPREKPPIFFFPPPRDGDLPMTCGFRRFGFPVVPFQVSLPLKGRATVQYICPPFFLPFFLNQVLAHPELRSSSEGPLSFFILPVPQFHFIGLPPIHELVTPLDRRPLRNPFDPWTPPAT